MPVGCGIHSRDLTRFQQELFTLPLLELEDYLDPDFAEHDREALPLIQQQLEQYRGKAGTLTHVLEWYWVKGPSHFRKGGKEKESLNWKAPG